jgi:siroheme synthase-like protein
MLLDLRGKKVVVVGAGRVATRKVRRLLASEAEVQVISPEVSQEILDWAEAGALQLDRRGAVPEDLEGARLVFLATDLEDLNDCLQTFAGSLGIPVNRADQPGGGDFQVPGETGKGDLRVFLSTSGRSPALAKILRLRIEELLEEDWERYLEVLEGLRMRLADQGLSPAQRSAFWRRFPSPGAWQALQDGMEAEFEQEVRRCVSSL